MNVAFIDVGSTSVKYQIFDKDSDIVVKEGKSPFPEPLIQRERKYEVSVAEIEKLVFEIMDRALENRCSRALISVQMHGFIILKDKKPITNYISWQDNRGDTENPALEGLDWYALGTAKKGNLPAVSLSLYVSPSGP